MGAAGVILLPSPICLLGLTEIIVIMVFNSGAIGREMLQKEVFCCHALPKGVHPL